MARRYSDKQAAEILSRAAELSVRDAPASGPTLDELERIAVEAGLDPASVRRAASELDRGGPSSSSSSATSKIAGAPASVVFETEMAGELDTNAHERIAELLLRRFPAGQPAVVGRTFTWRLVRSVGRRSGRTDDVTVTITSRDGRTVVRVEERYAGLLRRTFGASLGATVGACMAFVPMIVDGIAHGAVAAPLLVGGAMVAGVAGGAGLARTLFSRRVRGRQEELQALFNELCDVVAEALPPAAATRPPRGVEEESAQGLDEVRARLLPPAPASALPDEPTSRERAVEAAAAVEAEKARG